MQPTVSASCSWCHAMNIIGPPPVWCSECGHRADVSASACDCVRCDILRGVLRLDNKTVRGFLWEEMDR